MSVKDFRIIELKEMVKRLTSTVSALNKHIDKLQKRLDVIEHYSYCHECQTQSGYTMPKNSSVTVTEGICPSCTKLATLIPNRDYKR